MFCLFVGTCICWLFRGFGIALLLCVMLAFLYTALDIWCNLGVSGYLWSLVVCCYFGFGCLYIELCCFTEFLTCGLLEFWVILVFSDGFWVVWGWYNTESCGILFGWISCCLIGLRYWCWWLMLLCWEWLLWVWDLW